MPRPPISHEVIPVLTWLTPRVQDLLFYVERDGALPQNKTWNFGDPFPDRVKYPHHKLVHVTAQDEANWSRWYYAADREHQDDYNWELRNNDTVFRTYVVPRSEYPGTFTPPAVGTPDPKFTDYVFSGESVERLERELDSLYVTVRRTYSIPVLISYQWDDALQRSVKITREIVPAGSVTGSGTPGRIVEIQPGDKFYDLKITSEVAWGEGDLDGGEPNFPIQLDSIAADANYQFPLLLKQIQLFGAWAYATSQGAAPSYSEDFFFEVDTVEPHPGPFDATVLRFLTDDPETVRAAYPVTKIVSRAESFGLVKWWGVSSDLGNSSFALARQYNTPATVHDEIPLPSAVNYVQGGNMEGVTSGPGSQSLPATPNFGSFISSSTTIAGVQTKRSRFGLWEVQVIRIHAGGATVYQDDGSVLRGQRPGTGSGNIPLPGQGAGALEITIWNQPIVHAPESTIPANKTYADGGTATLTVWSKEPFDWEITLGGDFLSSSDPTSQPTAYPNGVELDFAYTANNTGSERTAVIRFTGQTTGYQLEHLIRQASN